MGGRKKNKTKADLVMCFSREMHSLNYHIFFNIPVVEQKERMFASDCTVRKTFREDGEGIRWR